MFSVSTVLGEKASDVEQSREANAKVPGRLPPEHWTGRGRVKESGEQCLLATTVDRKMTTKRRRRIC